MHQPLNYFAIVMQRVEIWLVFILLAPLESELARWHTGLESGRSPRQHAKNNDFAG